MPRWEPLTDIGVMECFHIALDLHVLNFDTPVKVKPKATFVFTRVMSLTFDHQNHVGVILVGIHVMTLI